jgi:signal transduction histidine kinase
VNTSLSIIKNYLAVIGGKLPEDTSCRSKISTINEEIDSVALIIRELSEPSQLKVRPNNPLDLNTFLSNQIKILQDSLILEPGINAHYNLDPSIPKVVTDKNKMKQIFWNLIINAAEAMPGGGNLNIRTRHVFSYIDAATDSSIDSTLGHVEITIRDDGPGFVDTVRSSLFEPYVTSKGAGHAGLGLSIAYNHVKELKGSITCESDNQKGAVFKIVIPVKHSQ